MPSTAEPSRNVSVALAIALLLLAGAVYAPACRFGFLNYDDQTYVWLNRYVQMGFTRESLRYALTASFGGWSPLVWLSFMLDKQLLGATAANCHTENIALHATGGVLLFLLLFRMTGARWRSWIAAALFVCHPMHVESVAWISERKDVLSTPLLLASMLAYWKYCRSSGRSRRWSAYGMMLLLYVASLMTKAMGVTLPVLLLLLDYWPLRRASAIRWRDRSFRWLLIEKIPLVSAAFIFSVISIEVQRAGGATAADAVLPLMDRIDNAVVCYVLYIVKLAMPTGLAAFYPHPGSRPVAPVFAASGLLVLVTVVAMRCRKTAPYLVVGWLWFLIALLPVIGIIQVGGQAMADRYSYLPSIGLCVAAVWGVGDLISICKLPPMSTAGRTIAAVLSVTVLAVFSVLARQQVRYWKDTETLFTHSYEVTGPNPVACFAIGTAAYSRGDLRSAADNLTTVVEQDPGNDKAMKLLGDIWVSSDLSRAIDYYQQAVMLKPAKVEYHIALGSALTRAGDRASLGSAADELREALRIDPKNSQARAGLLDVIGRLHRGQ